MSIRKVQGKGIPDTEEAKMRRKIILQEDKLFEVETANKLKQEDLQRRLDEKIDLELAVTELEKKNVDYKFQLQQAEMGHTVRDPDITRSESFLNRLKSIFLKFFRQMSDEISDKTKDLEKKIARLGDLVSMSARLETKFLERATEGTLRVGIQHFRDKKQLLVVVISASGLRPVNFSEKHSDPYVKVRRILNDTNVVFIHFLRVASVLQNKQ